MKSVWSTLCFSLIVAVAFASQALPARAQATTSSQAAQDDSAQSSSTALPPPKFFYSTEYKNGTVTGYLVNPSTGALTSTGQGPQWAHSGPTKIASDSGGYRLYVANQGSHDVSAYFIYRNNGYIYPVPGTNFTVGGVSTDIAVHPSNKFVYVTTAADDSNMEITGKSNSVTAFSVASNGSLVAVPGSPFVTDGPDWGIAIDPSGKYLYASSQVGDKNQDGEINAFSIDPTTGALTPIPGSPFAIIPYSCSACLDWEDIYGITIDPSGNFLMGAGYNNGVVYVYRIQAGTGSISEVAGSPFIEQPPTSSVGASFPSYGPSDVTVTPTDKYAFVSNDEGGQLAMYDFDSSTGALSNLTWSPSPYNTWGDYSSVVRSDPSGKFVYSLGWIVESNPKGGMIGFAIGSNGSLSIVPGAPYTDNGIYTGTPPVDGIAVTP
jgi:6-phosphogluconolactonase